MACAAVARWSSGLLSRSRMGSCPISITPPSSAGISRDLMWLGPPGQATRPRAGLKRWRPHMQSSSNEAKDLTVEATVKSCNPRAHVLDPLTFASDVRPFASLKDDNCRQASELPSYVRFASPRLVLRLPLRGRAAISAMGSEDEAGCAAGDALFPECLTAVPAVSLRLCEAGGAIRASA